MSARKRQTRSLIHPELSYSKPLSWDVVLWRLECLSGDQAGPVGLKVTLKTREHVGGFQVTE